MKWGNTVLNIIKDSYTPPYKKAKFSVIELIPNPENIADKNTIIQQGGTDRAECKFDGFVRSQAEYNALENDYINGIERVFDGADGVSYTMFIFDLAPTGRSLYPLKINYSIAFLEV